AGKIALSPDGTQLFVPAKDASELVVFDRDPGTGALIRDSQCFSASVAGCVSVPALAHPSAVAVTADGATVYATSDTSVVAIHRAAAGALSYAGCYGGGGCGAGIPAPSTLF